MPLTFVTAAECAGATYPGVTYDTALPQPWVWPD